MKIKCFAREWLDVKNPPKNTVLISINNKNQKNLENNFEDCLYLTFDDIKFEYKDFILFNQNHFNKIKKFIEKYKSKDIFINCTAGISRSGAIALGIAMLLNDKDLFWETLNNNAIYPNDYILSFFQVKTKRYWFSYYETVTKIKEKLSKNCKYNIKNI